MSNPPPVPVEPVSPVAGRWWPGVGAVSLLVFVLVGAVVVHSGGHDPFDQVLLRGAQARQSPGTSAVARLVLLASSPWAVLAATALAALGLRVRSHHLLLPAVLGLAVVTSAGVAYLVEVAVARPRPAAGGALPLAFSFPSVPTVEDLVLYGLTALLLAATTRRRAVRGVVLGSGLTLGMLGGLARVYLGVQWGSDVLAAWCLALAVVAFAWGAVLAATGTPSVLGIGPALDGPDPAVGERQPHLEPAPPVRGVHHPK